MTLNLFPVRAPIGRATISGQQVDVLMTPEFSRALADLFVRVGGASSPSLTTVVDNIGDIANAMGDIDGQSAFHDLQPSSVAAAQNDALFPPLFDFSSQYSDLKILFELTFLKVAELENIAQRIDNFAIQSAFVTAPNSPLPLAPDATDLPTVITLANSLKQALISNGIGS